MVTNEETKERIIDDNLPNEMEQKSNLKTQNENNINSESNFNVKESQKNNKKDNLNNKTNNKQNDNQNQTKSVNRELKNEQKQNTNTVRQVEKNEEKYMKNDTIINKIKQIIKNNETENMKKYGYNIIVDSSIKSKTNQFTFTESRVINNIKYSFGTIKIYAEDYYSNGQFIMTECYIL